MKPLSERARALLNGATTYDTGNACTRGHVAPRWTASGHCTVCQAAKASANTKRWREKHPNITEYRRAHEFIDTYARRAYQREYQKRDRQANPEKYAAKQKSWRVRHGLELRIYENNRRCKRLYDADGTLTVEDYRLQEERQGSKCNACGAHNTLEIDHVRPLCQGGSNWPDNVQLLCHACNKRKSLKEHG